MSALNGIRQIKHWIPQLKTTSLNVKKQNIQQYKIPQLKCRWCLVAFLQLIFQNICQTISHFCYISNFPSLPFGADSNSWSSTSSSRTTWQAREIFLRNKPVDVIPYAEMSGFFTTNWCLNILDTTPKTNCWNLNPPKLVNIGLMFFPFPVEGIFVKGSSR